MAAWAAACVERVVELVAPDDPALRATLERVRAFARGELPVAGEIRRRFTATASRTDTAALAAVARAAGQAAAVAHMGAHALGAAAYAARAAGLAAPDNPSAVDDEIRRQVQAMSTPVRAALRRLPPVGESRSGPLGPGLLASGDLGSIVRRLQAALAEEAR